MMKRKQTQKKTKSIQLPDEWFTLMKYCDEMTNIIEAQEKTIEKLTTQYEEYKILFDHYQSNITNCVWGRRRIEPKDYKKHQKQMKKNQEKMENAQKELETIEKLHEITKNKYKTTFQQAEDIRKKAFY